MNIIYYKCHITIDPFENDDQRKFIETTVAKNGFRIIESSIEITEPIKDQFIFARDVNFTDLNNRVNETLLDLLMYGIKLHCCKIKGIIRDDSWGYLL